MKKLISTLSFSLLVFTSGCKLNPDDKLITAGKGVGEFKVEEGLVFSKSQMSIIKNICTNLKNKRDYFNTLDDMKTRFRFKIESLSCDGKTITKNDITTVLSNTSSTDLEYYVDREDYLRNVITDQTAGIKYLCDNVGATNLNNVFFDSNLSYSFDVLISQGFNRIIMVKSVRNSAGKYIAKVAEGIDFVTLTNHGPQKLLGLENDRLRNTICDNGKVTYTKQTWLRE